MHFAPDRSLVLAALAVTLAAAAFDLRKGTIPRLLSLAPLPLGPALHALAMRGVHGPYGLPGPLFGAALSVTGAALCAAIPYAMYRLRLLGGGDVKLLATLGALLGPHWALPAEFYAFVLAGLYAPTRLAYQGRLFATLRDSALALIGLALPASSRRPAPDALWERIRFSPFVFLGTISSFAASSLASWGSP